MSGGEERIFNWVWELISNPGNSIELFPMIMLRDRGAGGCGASGEVEMEIEKRKTVEQFL